MYRGAVICVASIWILVLGAPLAALAAPPAGYYDTVDASTAATLRATLHPVIDDHQRYPYTSSSTDTWDILEQADEDPNNASNVLDVYLNASYVKVGGGGGPYNREHCWPKSYGFPKDGSTNYPYTDCHHLFVCNSGYNSSRSNKPYRYCSAACTEKVTNVNNGQGGGSGTYPGNSNWTSGSFTSGTWETWAGRRGDVARALMYMDIRYEGGTHGVTGASEPDLILTDNETLIASSNTGANISVAYMGMLSVLLQWHQEDPVDAVEQARNDVVYGFQGNRNPFIDHPEWVECLFNDVCGSGGGGGSGGSGSGSPWINEFHYDNASTDTGEFVEVAGAAGTDLTGWSVVAYNGNGGGAYKTVSLSGTIPDQQGCMGTLSFAFTSMQNGAPDGLALVDDTNAVIEFISYEGTFSATDGPASGMTSVDVGVSETSSTPVGYSLQLSGTGSASADFTWQSPAADTPGQLNSGQTFDGCGGGSGGGCTLDSECDDGVYCNGAETCVAGACQAGTPVNCDDGVACTDDSCNEGSASCDNVTNDANCDDGLFCNGAESCDAVAGCQAGTPINCDDGVSCTDDSCDEATVSCDNIVNDANCDNGLFCDGVEVCDALLDCQAGADPCPGMGCDEVADVCTSPPAGDPWINEFHYDNSGTDSGEFVEVAGVAGTDLSGWSVVGYNGNNGNSYKTVSLSGLIPDQEGCMGTLSFSFSAMQNGAPDGLALVDDAGVVLEFISYEGSFTANNGPAAGMTSVDIGVSESSGTAKGDSLQLGGSGSASGDFFWQSPGTDTPGQPNNGQTLSGC